MVLNKNPQYQTLILQIAVGRQDCIQNSSTNDMGLARMRKRVFSLDGEIQIVSEQVDGICAGMVINIKLPM